MLCAVPGFIPFPLKEGSKGRGTPFVAIAGKLRNGTQKIIFMSKFIFISKFT
jgi:hypothetical protein